MCVAFNVNTIVSGGWEETVRIWHSPFTEGCASMLEGHEGYPEDSVEHVWLCTAPNEHIIVSAGKKVLVHNIRTGKLMCGPIECYGK
jgi:hypothetical protein